MPRYDGTGPLGQGPRTGRGGGPCGGGYGRGRGYCPGYGGYGTRRFISPRNELAALEEEERQLETELTTIREEKVALKKQSAVPAR